MKKYQVFIKGETVDLVVPNKFAVEKTQWYNWFNNEKFTRILINHGLFPNTVDSQKIVLKKMIEANKEKTGLFLLMAEKKNHKLIGVCSLSKIDWVNRSAYMAIVMSPFRKRNFVFNSVETKALLTKHAFENLNLNKVRTTQVLELAEWQKYSNLFGYKVEGILRNHYLKGNKYYDVCLHSCLLEDYLKCKKKLGENFWPGKERLFKLMLKFPKGDIYEKVKKRIALENKIFDKKVEKILI